jgi:hypothetical protein
VIVSRFGDGESNMQALIPVILLVDLIRLYQKNQAAPLKNIMTENKLIKKNAKR